MSIKARALKARKVRGHKNGWTGWMQPVLHPKRFNAICCDCCLMHQMQFRIVRSKRGGLSIKFRIRRANLYTQMLRAKSKDITKLKRGEKIKAIRDGVMLAVLPNELRRGE